MFSNAPPKNNEPNKAATKDTVNISKQVIIKTSDEAIKELKAN